MFRNMKISIKILLVIMIMSLGSLLIIFGASYYFMNSINMIILVHRHSEGTPKVLRTFRTVHHKSLYLFYNFKKNFIDEFENTNITLGLNSSTIAKDSLLDQAEDYLVKIVDKQAQAANEKFYSVNKIVTQSSMYIHSLYTDSDNFKGKAIPAPDETVMGVASSKYFLVKGVENTQKIQDEVSILSNSEYMFAPYLECNSMLNNIYI